jgi:DNA-binding MarR family transcriptional regulator
VSAHVRSLVDIGAILMSSGASRRAPLPLGSRDGVDPKLVAAIDRLGQALRSQMGHVARANGLTATQLQLLVRLRVDPPERRRTGALAAELDVTLPTVSDSISTLVRKGLVDRGPEPSDGRGVRIVLTERGRAVADAADAWQVRAQQLLVSVSERDKQRALGFLTGLIAELHREGLVSVARMCVTCRFFRQDSVGPDLHRCVLLGLTLGPSDLRVDCPEHDGLAA